MKYPEAFEKDWAEHLRAGTEPLVAHVGFLARIAAREKLKIALFGIWSMGRAEGLREALRFVHQETDGSPKLEVIRAVTQITLRIKAAAEEIHRQHAG